MSAEATKQLMEQADYYMAKAKSYFQSDYKQEAFNVQVESNALKTGLDPEVAKVYANKMLVTELETQSARLLHSHPQQSMEVSR